MHRFYLPEPSDSGGGTLVLRGREAHHALHVLRIRAGDQATVLDGSGREFLCEVSRCGSDRVDLRILDQRQIPRPPCEITLLQALPKGKLIESIIQKATELGVTRIVPILSERVVVQIDSKDAAAKQSKWQMVAIEAIKQCGQVWLPMVEPPQSIDHFLGLEQRSVGSLQKCSRHPREYFRAFQESHGRNPRSISVWVGPEGDFTPAELAAIQSAGAQPITLGPLVLRSETAAIYCLSILNYELQWVAHKSHESHE
jgi:16S rRNA (uracil1498-N3)-methyltransferase